MNVEAILL